MLTKKIFFYLFRILKNGTLAVPIANNENSGLIFIFYFIFRKTTHIIYTKATNSDVSWSTDGRWK